MATIAGVSPVLLRAVASPSSRSSSAVTAATSRALIAVSSWLSAWDKGEALPARQSCCSARDLGLFRQSIPHRRPLGHDKADRFRLVLHVGGKGAAHLVVVAELQAIGPVARILGRPRAPEDVHGADVPLGKGRLRLVAGFRVLRQPLHPVLA